MMWFLVIIYLIVSFPVMGALAYLEPELEDWSIFFVLVWPFMILVVLGVQILKGVMASLMKSWTIGDMMRSVSKQKDGMDYYLEAKG